MSSENSLNEIAAIPLSFGIALAVASGVFTLWLIKKQKKFNLTLIFLCKSSWEFSRKNKCDNILNSWKMLFQVSDDKDQHFLELLDDNLNPIEPSVVKGGLSRSLTMDLTFIFTLHFFCFSIFRTTQVRVYRSRCHISHKRWHSHMIDHEMK